MIRKLILPALAAIGVLFALFMVIKGARPPKVAAAVAEPAKPPYAYYVAGAGLVEAATENIAIGTPVGGLVLEVYGQVGDRVKAGTPLFKIDDRSLRADLAVKQAAADSAKSRLDKLLKGTREEEVRVAVAEHNEALATRDEAKRNFERWVRMEGAATGEEIETRRSLLKVAEARVERARANLELLKAGTWEPDIAIARTEVVSAEAAVKSVQTEIDRMTVRSPVEGTLLQVKVRPGEYAVAGVLQTPLMLIGRTAETLHVRVDVDENEAMRVKENARARASIRGDSTKSVELRCVRIEPYIVPKRSLTGDSSERVDTRVLQVIYAFDPRDLRAYVGQQMDVFIEADPPAGAATQASSASRGGSSTRQGMPAAGVGG
jgi:multidrug resistance efflux pump